MQTTEFIMNLTDLYKPPLSPTQQGFYQQFLSQYTDNQLDELWQVTMYSHTASSPPAIGRLSEYAKKITKVIVVSEEDAKQEEINRLTEDDIFSTYLGKLSLKQGFASSYYITCKTKGIPDQDDNVLMEFQRGKYEAERAYEDCKSMANEGGQLNMASALMSLRESMLARNKELEGRYMHLCQDAQIEHKQLNNWD